MARVVDHIHSAVNVLMIDGAVGIPRNQLMRDVMEDVARCDALLYPAIPLNCPTAGYACTGFLDIFLEMPGKCPQCRLATLISTALDSIHTVH